MCEKENYPYFTRTRITIFRICIGCVYPSHRYGFYNTVSGMAEIYELLINCASQGDVSQLDSVLTNHRDVIDINFQTEGGLNLLMHVVISAGSNAYPKGRHLDVVKVLTRAGISLSVADISYGRTALHWAVHYDREDILTELLIAGKDFCLAKIFGSGT